MDEDLRAHTAHRAAMQEKAAADMAAIGGRCATGRLASGDSIGAVMADIAAAGDLVCCALALGGHAAGVEVFANQLAGLAVASGA